MPQDPDEFPGIATLLGQGLASGLSASVPSLTNTVYGSNQQQVGSSESDRSSFINSLIQGLTQNRGTSSQTTKGNLSPGMQALLGQLTGQFSKLATPDTKSLESNGINQINRNSDLQKESVAANLASRGLSSSPVAGTVAANVEGQRFGQINQFQAQLPQMVQQMQLTGANGALNFLNNNPLGSTTSGSSDSMGSSTQSNDQTSQDQIFGRTTQNTNTNGFNNQTQGTNQGGAQRFGLASLLASLFG